MISGAAAGNPSVRALVFIAAGAKDTRVPIGQADALAKALKANGTAWKNFQALAPSYRRHFVVWIHIAKRPETRERRIRESIELLAAGKKLGLK